MSKQTLIASIKKTFGCSQKDAEEWAQDIEQCTSEPNGRLSKFEEIAEHQHETAAEDELGEAVRLRQKGRAGIKFDAVAPKPTIMGRIKYIGGVR